MTVCPLCEHPQATGGECEVCGRKLSGTLEAPAVSPLEGLESTRLDDGLSASGEVEPVPGLEATRQQPVTAPAEPTPDLEPTRLEDVAVVVEPLADLEQTLADPLPWEERTPAVFTPVCRYCATPAQLGEVLCGRCGMRLPLLQTATAPPERAGARCPSCGSVSPAEICPGCGGRVRSPEAPPLAKRA